MLNKSFRKIIEKLYKNFNPYMEEKKMTDRKKEAVQKTYNNC